MVNVCHVNDTPYKNVKHILKQREYNFPHKNKREYDVLKYSLSPNRIIIIIYKNTKKERIIYIYIYIFTCQ